jgi:hypothetical protein
MKRSGEQKVPHRHEGGRDMAITKRVGRCQASLNSTMAREQEEN